jgi:hypothetical protein
MTTSIAECLAAGVVFEAHEAVAIAQQLITSLRDVPSGNGDAPSGPPAADTVLLRTDGSVICCSCSVTPAVSEIGIFLEQLLAPGSPRVPGALRYTMARALLNVDVPPFESIDDLSRDLSRHERGNRAELVRRVLARASAPRALATTPVAERRRHGHAVTTLRRELREADVRLYQQGAAQQRVGARQDTAIIDLVAAPPAYRGRRLSAAAACAAAGLLLIGAGQLMRLPSTPAAPQAARAPVQSPVSDEPRIPPPQTIADVDAVRERGIIAVHDVVRTPVRRPRPAARAVKTLARRQATKSRRPAA